MKQRTPLQKVNHEIRKRIGTTGYRSSNLKKYTSSNPLKQFFINRFLVSITDIVEGCSPERVIDVGCGEGLILKSLSLNHDLHIVGSDIDFNAVKFAKLLNPESHLFVADISSMPVKDGAFDLVICCEVLEHLSNPEDALKEIRRVSSKYCIISVPYEPYFSLMNLCSLKNLSSLGNDPDHINRWTRRGFEEILRIWFEDITIHTSIPWLIARCKIDSN